MTARGLHPAFHPCVLHRSHSPVLWATHRHHVVPESWTKALGLPDYRIVTVCPTGHDALHRALAAVMRGDTPERRLTPAMHDLVMEAYDWAVQKERESQAVGRYAMFVRMATALT